MLGMTPISDKIGRKMTLYALWGILFGVGIMAQVIWTYIDLSVGHDRVICDKLEGMGGGKAPRGYWGRSDPVDTPYRRLVVMCTG